MTSFLLALQFLTILPLKIKDFNEKRIVVAMIFFPFVGLLLGALLALINMLLVILHLPASVISIILVVALIVITGGMHLDGLADTADAFLSGKPKEEMLKIMRDSHIGVMGVLSLISVILLKVGLFYSVGTSLKVSALILMCILSRWSALWMMFLFPYARGEGKARVFMEGMSARILILSTITAVFFAFLSWQIKGILTLLIIAGCTYLWGKIIGRKIKGITGDTLGAGIELSEIVTLFAVCIS
jgi:adenosylcobinamide-GDP ribazoletransferase